MHNLKNKYVYINWTSSKFKAFTLQNALLKLKYKLNSKRKLFIKYMSEKELVHRIYKEHSKHNVKKNLTKKLAKDTSQMRISRWQITNRRYVQK